MPFQSVVFRTDCGAAVWFFNFQPTPLFASILIKTCYFPVVASGVLYEILDLRFASSRMTIYVTNLFCK